MRLKLTITIGVDAPHSERGKSIPLVVRKATSRINILVTQCACTDCDPIDNDGLSPFKREEAHESEATFATGA